MLSVRPKIAELVFQLYGRPLHPELFEIFATQKVSRGDHQATIHITSAGHVVTWQYKGLTLTEVACSAQHELPQKRRLMQYKLKGRRIDSLECRGGARYQMEFSLEPVAPDVFYTYQAELTAKGVEKGLLHCFDASGRMALGALSYIHVETRQKSLRVQVFHTFPDDYAIMKSQSLFEAP